MSASPATAREVELRRRARAVSENTLFLFCISDGRVQNEDNTAKTFIGKISPLITLLTASGRGCSSALISHRRPLANPFQIEVVWRGIIVRNVICAAGKAALGP